MTRKLSLFNGDKQFCDGKMIGFGITVGAGLINSPAHTSSLGGATLTLLTSDTLFK